MSRIKAKFDSDLRIPNNFVKTAVGHTGGIINRNVKQPAAQLNPQTKSFCAKLGVDDPLALILNCENDSISSFLDESNLDESQNVTFIDDSGATDFSIDSMNTSIRTRLSLPEPKSDNYDSSVCDVSLTELKEEINETEDAAPNAVDEVAAESPRPKKFIRRNADIYNEENCT